MTASKPATFTNLDELDAHVIQLEEYEDIPELTDEMVARSDLYENGRLIRRGRPKLDTPKAHVTIRLDADLVARLRASGRGWQGRVNAALRKVEGM